MVWNTSLSGTCRAFTFSRSTSSSDLRHVGTERAIKHTDLRLVAARVEQPVHGVIEERNIAAALVLHFHLEAAGKTQALIGGRESPP